MCVRARECAHARVWPEDTCRSTDRGSDQGVKCWSVTGLYPHLGTAMFMRENDFCLWEQMNRHDKQAIFSSYLSR